MIACRLLPRPEIRTAIREGRPSRIHAGSTYRTDRSPATTNPEPERIRLAGRRQQVDDALGVARRADDHEPDAHVEGAEHLVASGSSPRC